MAISIADNFSYKGSKPLDARFQFSSVANMKAEPVANLYDGCLAYVTATKKYYTYDSSNTSTEETGKWAELQTGGGGSWVELTGTLIAGETSITFTDSTITTSSFVDVYTDADIPYNSITVTTGSIVLTYDAQQSNVTVKVRLS